MTRLGRPPVIDRQHDLRPDGTPRTISQAICDYIGEGCYAEEASALVGIDAATIRLWLRTAARIRLQDRHEQDDLTQYEQSCLTFLTAYTTAHATWVRSNHLAMDEIGRGGRRITTIREKRRFNPDEDPNAPGAGHVVERITEVKTMPPDPQAIIWRMAMRNPGRYSPKFQIIEADGAGLTDEEVADATADSFAAYLQGAEDERQRNEQAQDTTS